MIFIKPPKDKYRYHVWFAWYPVCVHTYPDGGKKYVWLKRILRSYRKSWFYEEDEPCYKEIENENSNNR